jgi:alpha-tubulin suppressor-like RCC1 family protein
VRRCVESLILGASVLVAACHDAPVTPGAKGPPDRPQLAEGGVPGPPPGHLLPNPPGPPPRVPVPLPPQAKRPGFLTNILEIGAGGDYSCALRSDGVVLCWGANGSGQFGNGSIAPSVTPVETSGETRFAHLIVGDTDACGLTSTGEAYCWGSNNSGQLGAGMSATQSLVPVPVAGGHRFVDLSVGLGTTCGVATDGVTYCWGSNTFGVLGNGVFGGSSNVPVAVSANGLPAFQAVSVGFFGACARTASSAVYCWGQAALLGNGVVPQTATPVLALGGGLYKEVDAGSIYGCGVTTSGETRCWGQGTFGELGTGSFVSAATPMPVVGGLALTQLDVNNNNIVFGSTCGLTAAGEAWCWGSNRLGQLGAPSASTCSFTNVPNFDCSAVPLRVTGGVAFKQIAVGREHMCALSLTNVAWCWGANNMGQLGDGSLTNSSTPVAVNGLRLPQQIGSVVASPSSALLRVLGITQQFSATALAEDGTPLASQPAFMFTSSNPAVATVSPSGLATAVTTGLAIISATAPNGMVGQAVLNVNIIDPVVAFRQAWSGATAGSGSVASEGIVALGGLLADE